MLRPEVDWLKQWLQIITNEYECKAVSPALSAATGNQSEFFLAVGTTEPGEDRDCCTQCSVLGASLDNTGIQSKLFCRWFPLSFKTVFPAGRRAWSGLIKYHAERSHLFKKYLLTSTAVCFWFRWFLQCYYEILCIKFYLWIWAFSLWHGCSATRCGNWTGWQKGGARIPNDDSQNGSNCLGSPWTPRSRDICQFWSTLIRRWWLSHFYSLVVECWGQCWFM